jgi:hypothetical protein
MPTRTMWSWTWAFSLKTTPSATNEPEILPRSRYRYRYSALAVQLPQRWVSTPPPTVPPPLVVLLLTEPVTAGMLIRLKVCLMFPQAPPPVTYHNQSPLVYPNRARAVARSAEGLSPIQHS